MSSSVLQNVLEVLFSDIFFYLSPILFVFAFTLFSDRLIDLAYGAIQHKRRR
ncbi:hypothetical protein [Desertibacillus haloalkaliphilus]|uniref:hypothetical protein n=1 Tax=Desertibacillus haloalkaliphilus TaxID=1328930 RepID=UPI001C25F35C|nr:hypothetical protein [Desertibacillus haloalkaliphilus]MBU8905576.1 hypothetical protein [Desertibacillus haloalkaliphilus]